MRNVNFKNDVLWAIAYKLGLEPAVNLLRDQASAYVSYVNAWVRRLWDAADWGEWTITAMYAVQTATGLEHIVSWNALPLDYIPLGFDAPQPGASLPLIGKVLKVYLVDPRSTRLPVDTPFRLSHLGIHCGFEHGENVWIKFVTRCPQFTSEEWNATRTYALDELTYSPVSGECYRSKSNGNVGNDPTTSSQPFPPPVEVIQKWIPDDPGIAERAEIMVIALIPAVPPPNPPDPPPNGSIVSIFIGDTDNNVLADAFHTANGAESLATILNDVRDQLDADLDGSWTITADTDALTITLTHLSKFKTLAAYYKDTDSLDHFLKVVVTQTYVPPTAPVGGQPQISMLGMNAETTFPGATYSLSFVDFSGIAHFAEYASNVYDNSAQILQGLILAIELSTDTYFQGVQLNFDPTLLTLTFSIKGNDSINTDVILRLPETPWWEIVSFPFSLVDQVVRGSYADSLREGGQTDKAVAEEQVVPTEEQVRTAAQVAPQYDAITDQAQQKSRYMVK